MQDIGRTTTLDPMAEKFYDLSPQSFLNNNPLSFIDPTGMEAQSPIFDNKTGKYLGSDSQGFMRGDVLFMDASKYKELQKSSENGVVDHEAAVANGESIADLKATPENVQLFHSAVDFVSKVTYMAFHGVNPSNGLLNGEISVSSDELGIGTNNPANIGTDYGQNKNVAKGSNGSLDIDKVTINFDNRKDLNNAGNIGSLFEHEYHFHGVKDARNTFMPSYDAHSKVYPLQAKTSIFDFTTGNYRTHVLQWSKFYEKK
jgi:hypothetical protein